MAIIFTFVSQSSLAKPAADSKVFTLPKKIVFDCLATSPAVRTGPTGIMSAAGDVWLEEKPMFEQQGSMSFYQARVRAQLSYSILGEDLVQGYETTGSIRIFNVNGNAPTLILNLPRHGRMELKVGEMIGQTSRQRSAAYRNGVQYAMDCRHRLIN